MTAQDQEQLLRALEARFGKNTRRREGVAWADVRTRLEADPGALGAIQRTEATGGEPDVVGADGAGRYTFCDCCAENPGGRRGVCYDRAALDARKEHKPAGSAVEMAAAMGVSLLTEEQYRELQTFGEFDLKTSSWVEAPPGVRALGGAVLRPAVRPGVRVPRRGAVVLRRPGLPGVGPGVRPRPRLT